MVGTIIIVAVLIFLVFWFSFPQGEGPHLARPHQDQDLVQLLASRDPIEVEAIKDALRANDIQCMVLDQYMTALSGKGAYLPDIAMRIMVFPQDYENAVKIVKDFFNQEVEPQ